MAQTLTQLLVMVLALSLAACEQRQERPIRLGTNAWPGYAPLHLAEEIGALDERYDVVDLGSTNELLKGMVVGALDGGGVTLDELLNARDLGLDLVVVTITNISHGADAIVAQPGITALGDLKGRTIGCEATALCSLMLRRAADLGGFKPDDVRGVPLSLLQHESAFDAGEVDALITFEPVRTRLLQKGGVEVFSSEQIPNEIIDVLVIKRTVWQERPEAVADLVESWFKGVEYLETHRAEALELIDQRLHLGIEGLMQAFSGLVIPDRDDVEALIADRGKALQATLRRIERIMIDHGDITTAGNNGAFFPDPRKPLIRDR